MAWECGIDDCGSVFEDVESAVVHQADAHERRECEICGTVVPDGFLAIYHTFTNHSRAEYVRAYDADSAAIRTREELLEDITADIDQQLLAEMLASS
ncbi:hypothetical protein C479_12968 [Halovivax asiaticus JCM 14624]|uniref:C2H2-type domain-containing protein n=1 Tax=Halovivax asiaticus JCM 14624 TaxID=1227490 RepID=M0BBF5_9EURY|nr:hypothetical protein [Halovivax asiaticus]ELZ08251.1 hypothetical protein C479_12968 [Halovivax asiaticus JCM 14624]